MRAGRGGTPDAARRSRWAPPAARVPSAVGAGRPAGREGPNAGVRDQVGAESGGGARARDEAARSAVASSAASRSRSHRRAVAAGAAATGDSTSGAVAQREIRVATRDRRRSARPRAPIVGSWCRVHRPPFGRSRALGAGRRTVPAIRHARSSAWTSLSVTEQRSGARASSSSSRSRARSGWRTDATTPRIRPTASQAATNSAGSRTARQSIASRAPIGDIAVPLDVECSPTPSKTGRWCG